MATQKTVIVIGGGLAGLMASMKLAEAGHKVKIFSIVPVKRSHSVCAQGGINGAVNLRGEGDSPFLHFEDTITGGDFLNHQPPVMRMAERAPAIIYLLDRMGVPFNRTAEGLLSFRRFGGTLKHRTAYAGATTGQQLLYALDEQVRRWETMNMVEKFEGFEFLGIIKDSEGRCRGITAQNLRTMEIDAYAADAVVLATGGNGLIFGKSTNSIINTGAAVSIAYQAGAKYGNPEMVQIHPTAIPGEDKCRLISESVRGEGGRIWVPRDPMDARKPVDIPETDRWYVCEEMDSKYGNLLSRDIVSFIMYCVCRMDRGIQKRQQVYLDITQLHKDRGGQLTREQINDKLEGVLEIYEKFMREDPITTPMRIYPAVHYTMGGLWVDYETNGDNTWDVESPRNQMTNVPGLYAAGEAEYQYHGANRLGANALLACLVGGEIAAEGIVAYLGKGDVMADSANSLLGEAKREKQAEYASLKKSNGGENPYRLHAELADTMWNNCGIWRVQNDLITARTKLDELAERARKCNLIDDSGWSNQAVPFTRAVIHMIEQSKAIVDGAIVRDESRGAHFKMDTPERDDKKWLVTTLASYDNGKTKFDFEPIDTRFLSPRPRKYAVNQIMIVKKLMGEDFLAGFSAAAPVTKPKVADKTAK
jgi:succinate dehydrogenase / fumarate reductase, flavoprotein subunit